MQLLKFYLAARVVTFNKSVFPENANEEGQRVAVQTRSVARKETLDVHQKNWVCHIYCQNNAKKNKKSMLIGY